MENIKCKCGEIELALAPHAKGTRINCYCESCRGFIRSMGAQNYLDEDGAVGIFQTTPHQIQIIKGQDQLAAKRITPKGAMRWHCAQCKTPLVNSKANSSFPFMGLILPHTHSESSMSELGSVKTAYMTKERTNTSIQMKDYGGFSLVTGVILRALGAKISGKSTKSDWHDEIGNWRGKITIMSEDDRTNLYKKAKSL